MTTERDVWLESEWTAEGLSVSVYSQAADQEPVLEDEAWWTWQEIAAEALDADSPVDLPADTYHDAEERNTKS